MQSSVRRVRSAQTRRERLRRRAPRGVKPAAIRVQVLFFRVAAPKFTYRARREDRAGHNHC